MSRRKLDKFDELDKFSNVFQPKIVDINNNFYLQNNWHKEFFQNNNSISLELGCGKGEYTIGLASKFPDKNFIGVDIKGARIWKGAKYAIENQIKNIAFIRTNIDFIDKFFGKNEISEIWITFPDPQPKKQKKRLTSSKFLNKYRNILKKENYINLKTDNEYFFYYTLMLLNHNNIKPLIEINDLYNSDNQDYILNIKTYYERGFIKLDKKIHYLKFSLENDKEITEIEKYNFKHTNEFKAL